MFCRAPQGARLRSAAPVRRGTTLAARRLWTACCPSAKGRGDAGMIVIRPLSGDDRPAAGGAACRHRQVGLPDGRGGAARLDRRRGRPGDAHPASPAVVGPPGWEAACRHQGRRPQLRPRHRRGTPRPGHPLQRCLPPRHRTLHGLREVADLQAPGVDVSDAATATAQGRIGTPVEVAQAALPLASDTARFVKGAHLFVENGFAAG